MSLIRKIQQRRKRRVLRVRSKMRSDLPRVSVFKSLNQIYAQIIDDAQHRTLLSLSSLQISVSGDKKAVAFALGKELGQKAMAQGIVAASFDRGAFLYHGRIKSLADGLREAGLRI